MPDRICKEWLKVYFYNLLAFDAQCKLKRSQTTLCHVSLLSTTEYDNQEIKMNLLLYILFILADEE